MQAEHAQFKLVVAHSSFVVATIEHQPENLQCTSRLERTE